LCPQTRSTETACSDAAPGHRMAAWALIPLLHRRHDGMALWLKSTCSQAMFKAPCGLAGFQTVKALQP
jgi:hypothetical protein